MKNKVKKIAQLIYVHAVIAAIHIAPIIKIIDEINQYGPF